MRVCLLLLAAPLQGRTSAPDHHMRYFTLSQVILVSDALFIDTFSGAC
jgi:hypothetical protein